MLVVGGAMKKATAENTASSGLNFEHKKQYSRESQSRMTNV